MQRQTIESSSVPRFRVEGHSVDYSPVVEVKGADRVLFISGQNAFDENGDVVGVDDIEAQVRQTLVNIQTLLTEAGGSMDDIVKITTWLTKPEYVGPYVRIRKEFFNNAYPASSTVVSDLVQDDLLIEIEAVAVLD